MFNQTLLAELMFSLSVLAKLLDLSVLTELMLGLWVLAKLMLGLSVLAKLMVGVHTCCVTIATSQYHTTSLEFSILIRRPFNLPATVLQCVNILL